MCKSVSKHPYISFMMGCSLWPVMRIWRSWCWNFTSFHQEVCLFSVHRIIDFHWRKRRMNLGICKQNASNPRIRSSYCRILTSPAEFDTSKRNHGCCLRRLSSNHLCWSYFGAGLSSECFVYLYRFAAAVSSPGQDLTLGANCTKQLQ